MTYEQQLDYILKVMYDKHRLDEGTLCYHIKPNVTMNDFMEYKQRLINDEYLEEIVDGGELGFYNISSHAKRYTYSIASKGRHLVESGEGYEYKANQERKLAKINMNTYKMNWVAIGIALISLIVAIIALFR